MITSDAAKAIKGAYECVWKLQGDAMGVDTLQSWCNWHVLKRGLNFYVGAFAPNKAAKDLFFHLYNSLHSAEDIIVDDYTFTEAWKKVLHVVSGWSPYVARHNQRPQHVLGKDGDGVAASGTWKIKVPLASFTEQIQTCTPTVTQTHIHTLITHTHTHTHTNTHTHTHTVTRARTYLHTVC